MRAPSQFCYEPIRRVTDAAMNDNKDKLWPMLEKLKVKEKLKPADFDLMGKPLMKASCRRGPRRRRASR